ncbi:hypothetical protein ACQPZZ_10455 [Microbispora sp. CA-135349]|uniref:hypothetical protein n=1 Tax=Microbispora sp. CA-135349 TaxID=3239953 RepID=UPI003D9346F2
MAHRILATPAKMAVMVTAEDLAFLERSMAAEGVPSRSSAVRTAIALLRARSERE